MPISAFLRRGLATLSVVLVAGPLWAQAQTADPMPLAAHRATYKLSLLRSSGSKAPESVDGYLAYEFTGSACEGYTSTVRQLTALQPQEGESHVSEMQTVSVEGGDAQDFRFKVNNKGDSAADVDGTAHRAADGGLSIALQAPKAEDIAAPSEVLFPTQHLRKVLATAKAGGKLLSAQVFDGSDTGKKIFNTLTVIGAETDVPAPEKAADQDGLKGVHRWPATISYFDGGKPDDPPEYVLSFDLYENGISRALRLDYGTFTLSGDLTELTILPATSCPK